MQTRISNHRAISLSQSSAETMAIAGSLSASPTGSASLQEPHLASRLLCLPLEIQHLIGNLLTPYPASLMSLAVSCMAGQIIVQRVNQSLDDNMHVRLSKWKYDRALKFALETPLHLQYSAFENALRSIAGAHNCLHLPLSSLNPALRRALLSGPLLDLKLKSLSMTSIFRREDNWIFQFDDDQRSDDVNVDLLGFLARAKKRKILPALSIRLQSRGEKVDKSVIPVLRTLARYPGHLREVDINVTPGTCMQMPTLLLKLLRNKAVPKLTLRLSNPHSGSGERYMRDLHRHTSLEQLVLDASHGVADLARSLIGHPSLKRLGLIFPERYYALRGDLCQLIRKIGEGHGGCLTEVHTVAFGLLDADIAELIAAIESNRKLLAFSMVDAAGRCCLPLTAVTAIENALAKNRHSAQ